ncbi:MAG: hypothetical protein ABI346_10560 [Candidatus Baltobacteraceae bacterium]
MRFSWRLALSAFAFGCLPIVSAAAEPSLGSVIASLTTMRHVADAVVAGHDTTRSQYRQSARKIGIAWARVEPAIVKRGHIVEAHFLNRSVTAFEHDWKSPATARANAKNIGRDVTTLMRVLHEAAAPSPKPTGTASPAFPSGQPSTRPSSVPTSPASTATAAPATESSPTPRST